MLFDNLTIIPVIFIWVFPPDHSIVDVTGYSAIEDEQVESDLETTIDGLKKTNPLTGTLNEEVGFLMLPSRFFAKSKLPLIYDIKHFQNVHQSVIYHKGAEKLLFKHSVENCEYQN